MSDHISRPRGPASSTREIIPRAATAMQPGSTCDRSLLSAEARGRRSSHTRQATGIRQPDTWTVSGWASQLLALEVSSPGQVGTGPRPAWVPSSRAVVSFSAHVRGMIPLTSHPVPSARPFLRPPSLACSCQFPPLLPGLPRLVESRGPLCHPRMQVTQMQRLASGIREGQPLSWASLASSGQCPAPDSESSECCPPARRKL